ncbi:Inorganic pyrophosphatase 1 [Linum perenne]
MAGIVVVFDFDKTIIDVDSDNWVIDELGFTDLFNQLLPTMPWNSLMDRMMMEIHQQGKTVEDIVGVLNRGLVMERMQESMAKEAGTKMIYLGDGAGDYCPSLKLREADYVMPRKNFPVWDLISRNPMVIKAEIHEWSDGEELERVLLEIVSTITAHHEQLLAEAAADNGISDCKFQTIAVPAAPFNRRISVPQ